MVRWRKRRRVAAFVGGEGAPVGGDGRCGVRGVADGGDARPESTRESGLPVAECGGLGAGSGGEARALERRSQRGVETGERVGAVVGAAERERTERGGGSGRRSATRRGMTSWGLAPTVSRSAATRMRRTRAVRHCSDSGALAPTRRAPVIARVGRRGWHVGARGPAREEKRGGRAQMNNKVLHLFELV
jgi:hypothetical protein